MPLTFAEASSIDCTRKRQKTPEFALAKAGGTCFWFMTLLQSWLISSVIVIVLISKRSLGGMWAGCEVHLPEGEGSSSCTNIHSEMPRALENFSQLSVWKQWNSLHWAVLLCLHQLMVLPLLKRMVSLWLCLHVIALTLGLGAGCLLGSEFSTLAQVQAWKSPSSMQGSQSQCDPCFLGQVNSNHQDSYPESMDMLPQHFLNYHSLPARNISLLFLLQ